MINGELINILKEKDKEIDKTIDEFRKLKKEDILYIFKCEMKDKLVRYYLYEVFE